MQQNNQNITAFQNSMRKNSWQKPKSLYEMGGYGVGGDSNLDAFDRRDMEEEPARQREREALNAILVRPKGKDGKPLKNEDGTPVLSDVEDLAAQAHQNFVDSGGTGHHGVGKAEAHGILSDHGSWRSLSDSAKDTVVGEFMTILNGIHDHHMASQEYDGRLLAADAAMKRNRPVE